MLVSIISLPLTINYLGEERFGMMETIVALIMMMSFADLGLGFGLQNRIAELENNKDDKKLRKAISSVFFILIGVSIFLSCMFFITYSFVPWEKIFNVKSELAIEEAPLAVAIFFSIFIVQIPFSIVRKVQLGLQEGYINEIWRSLGNITGLIGLLFVIYMKLGVPYIILSIYGANAIFLILNFLRQFIWKRNFLFPKWHYFNFSVFKELYKDGLVFFGLQIATIVLTSSDRLMIAHFINAEAVALYSIGFRLSMIFATPIDAFVSPLLPAFNDAIALKDQHWIKNILTKGFITILIVSSILGIVLVLGGNAILDIWIGGNIQLTIGLLISFGAFVLYTNLNSLISYVMLTPTLINRVLKIFTIAATLTIILKIVFINYFNIQGILWAGILGMSLFFFIPSIKVLKKVNFI